MTSEKKSFLDRMYSITDSASADEIRAVYDEWADSYDTNLVDENGYAMPDRAAVALDQMWDQSIDRSSVQVLDIGCGTGLSGVALKKKGFVQIDGCDLSDGMLQHAKASGAYQRLFQANLMSPPIDVCDARYDAVTAVGVFSFGHLNPDAVGEILRVVVSGGPVVLTVNDHYERDAKLGQRLEQFKADGLIQNLSGEYGAHIPERDVRGYVYSFTRI